MKKTKLFAIVLSACIIGLSACVGGTGSTSEYPSITSSSVSETDEVKGRIDTIEQGVAAFAGTYYDFNGVSFEVVEVDKGIQIMSFSVPQSGGDVITVPDTPIIYDSDCELVENNEIHYYFKTSEYTWFDLYFLTEDGHISFGYTDFNYGPFGGVFGNFSKDSSVIKNKHYYREIRVTYDEKSFGDCFDHVHPVGYYDLPCDYGYDDYYQFLYDTETGYVESIKLFYTFTTHEDWDSESFKEGRDSLKETLLSDAEKYNIIDVSFFAADYQVVVSFGTDIVGKFDTEISHLLSERQDINEFVKDVSRDLDQHPDLKPEEGSNYIYVLTSAECDGVRVEWYD